MMFAPDICIAALRAMREKFGDDKRIWGKYGFIDAFNPTSGWIDTDVIGINVGITLVSAENLRTGKVWRWFMGNSEIPSAMRRVGLGTGRVGARVSVGASAGPIARPEPFPGKPQNVVAVQ